MEPYTAEGMAWRESQQTTGSSNTDITDDSSVFRQPMVVVDPVTAASPSKSVENRLSDTSDGCDAISIPVVSSTSSGTRLSVEAAVSSTAVNVSHINYELVGVVVHSGQANAGHYYSFIKERRCVFDLIS
jgi:ubiquitin carboxyl-terminal hydrolase 9/24